MDRWDSCCDEMTASISLSNDTFYDIVLQYKELSGSASFRVEWFSNSFARKVLSFEYLYYSQRVTDVTLVTVTNGPSIPERCTI